MNVDCQTWGCLRRALFTHAVLGDACARCAVHVRGSLPEVRWSPIGGEWPHTTADVLRWNFSLPEVLALVVLAPIAWVHDLLFLGLRDHGD